MRGFRVMRANYSFLWQYLEPSQLLPKLVDKLLMTETARKEAELYTQKFAQNAVIINELFGSGCPPLKLCDTLDVTGQGHIARKLLQGTHCVGCICQWYRLYFKYLCILVTKLQNDHKKEQNKYSPPHLTLMCCPLCWTPLTPIPKKKTQYCSHPILIT